MPEITLLDFFKFVSGGGVGGLAGSIATHLFNSRRDRKTRRGIFIGFLRQWRCEIERIDPKETEKVWTSYISGVQRFYNELGRVEMDFRRDGDFTSLSNSIGIITHTEIAECTKEKGNRCHLIASKIDSLVTYITKNA